MNNLAELEEFRRKKKVICFLLRRLGWSYTMLEHKEGGYFLSGARLGRTQNNVIQNLKHHTDEL